MHASPLCLPSQLGGKGGINDLINTLSALMCNMSVATTSNPARSGLVAMPKPPTGTVNAPPNESTKEEEAQKADPVGAVAAALPEAAVGFE